MNMNFGKKLRELRNLNGISRMELSKRSGISYYQVSKYEDNKSNPTLPALLKLGEALSISPEKFFVSINREHKLERINKLISNSDSNFTDDQVDLILGYLESLSESGRIVRSISRI